MEETNAEESAPRSVSAPQPEFKKPVLVGRVGKLPRKVKGAEEPPQTPPPPPPAPAPEEKKEKSALPPAVLLREHTTPIPYKEPKWSGLPPEGSNYSLEVLKSGVIVDKVDLMSKPFHVFGRLANCDIVMAHPTISRHHSVLQYKAISEEGDRPSGFYMWDCNSTHGTFLNRQQLKPQHYTRLRVGHMIKLGCSSRTYILLGPEWDAEGESELTITEMKQKHTEMKAALERRVREAAELREKEAEEEGRRREEAGVDWGMGDDAEEETDLSENPFAATTNEELYLDDPKKTLRGYYEREGLELVYDCQEKAPGQFVCRVELPIEDARGQALVAEAIHRGKKKEAVVACALEACRVIDRHGLLRQAKHESRRRKQRDWSADDYYDSDDDTFLERTGAVERKRRLRMLKHEPGRAQDERLTYTHLVDKCTELRTRVRSEEARLAGLRARGSRAAASGGGDAPEGEGDDLDRYMSTLASHGQSMAQKAQISQLKMEIAQLKTELTKNERLMDIAKPATLPELVKPEPVPETSRLKVKVGSNSVIYGKRMRLKDDMKVKIKKDVVRKVDEEFVEEVDSDEEDRLKEGESEKDDNVSTDEQTGDERVSNKDARLRSDEKVSKSENEGTRGDEKVSTNKFEIKNEKAESNIINEDESVSTTRDETLSKNDTAAAAVSKKDKKCKAENSKTEDAEEGKRKRVFGPMRPPENYTMPESYLTAETDRDLPEIMEDEE